MLLLFAKSSKRTIESEYIASQKAWFTAFIAIIKNHTFVYHSFLPVHVVRVPIFSVMALLVDAAIASIFSVKLVNTHEICFVISCFSIAPQL